MTEQERILNRIEQVKASLRNWLADIAEAEAEIDKAERKRETAKENIAAHKGMLQALEFILESLQNP